MGSASKRERRTLYIVGVAVILCIVTPYVCPWWFPFLPLLPIFYAVYVGVAGERKIDGLLCAMIYCTYYAILMYPISFLFSFIPYRWFLLFSYSLFFFMYNRDLCGLDRETIASKLWFKIWLNLCWNAPLLISWYFVSYLGGQLCSPLITIIDDNICVGALPCSTKNVLSLYSDPYHIRAIINLCDESVGQINEYQKYNMDYLQLKTLDTTPPSIDNINSGIEFIEKFVKWKKENNFKFAKIFIHCKGGRGRSITLALCWMISQGIKANDAMKILKSKRKQAAKIILQYNTVKHFIKKFQK